MDEYDKHERLPCLVCLAHKPPAVQCNQTDTCTTSRMRNNLCFLSVSLFQYGQHDDALRARCIADNHCLLAACTTMLNTKSFYAFVCVYVFIDNTHSFVHVIRTVGGCLQRQSGSISPFSAIQLVDNHDTTGMGSTTPIVYIQHKAKPYILKYMCLVASCKGCWRFYNSLFMLRTGCWCWWKLGNSVTTGKSCAGQKTERERE